MKHLVYASDLFPFIKLRIEELKQDIYKEFYSENQKRYYNEYATIRINLGRRTGNSYLASKILEQYPDSYLFVYTLDQAEKNFFKIYKKRIFSLYKENFIESVKDNKFNICIVDCTTLMSQSKIDKITEIMKPMALVLLG